MHKLDATHEQVKIFVADAFVTPIEVPVTLPVTLPVRSPANLSEAISPKPVRSTAVERAVRVPLTVLGPILDVDPCVEATAPVVFLRKPTIGCYLAKILSLPSEDFFT